MSRSITTLNRVRPTYGWWRSCLDSHRSGLHPTCMLQAEPERHGQNRYQNHDSHTLGTRRFDIGTDPRWNCGRCLRLDQPVVVDHTRRPGEKMKVIINHRAGNKRKHLRAQARTDMASEKRVTKYTHMAGFTSWRRSACDQRADKARIVCGENYYSIITSHRCDAQDTTPAPGEIRLCMPDTRFRIHYH